MAFGNHYDAVKHFLPGQAYNNLPPDQKKLQLAARKKGYDTLQFISNNENGIFMFEILDVRYDADSVSCPDTTKHIYQFASKPYTCQCHNSDCLNCKINNPSYQGYFPSCFRCTSYKYNTECLSSCPTGTIAKKAYYSDEEYICLSKSCVIDGCQKCDSEGKVCLACYNGFTLKNEECEKNKFGLRLGIFMLFGIILGIIFI
eukprot:TRINITY_DN2286_c0_g1_i3.p3 TRINITY_DN2286_c0_g1~~TRINITY_DN2286_c0_g1_i3.p3  ORF type:complete len:202 (+),score=28.61 TRINITY_DN2286_c0_g1_i3:1068-1673(+)